VWTKGRRLHARRLPKVNYNYRATDLCFIAGLSTIPLQNKIVGLVFTSSGQASYVPLSSTQELFKLTRMKSVFEKKNAIVDQLRFSDNRVVLSCSFYLVHQLPKNKHVSLLELFPGKGIQYARSTGTAAKILKMDSRVSTSLVKLPSGVKKVFSTHSLASLGPVALFENRK
jgi:ribosomal protein L2